MLALQNILENYIMIIIMIFTHVVPSVAAVLH
jgi:hypothetical protein